MIKDIFIIHWKQLKERKENLENQLLELREKVNIFWIDFYDRDTISQELINSIYKKNKQIWDNRLLNLYNNPPIYRELKISEICNSLSHIYVIDYIIDHNLEYGIVLEDDVILNNEFFNFDYYFENTPEDFDVIFFGSSFSPQILDNVGFDNDKPAINIQDNVYVYEKIRNPKTRTVDAYILKNETCKKLKNIINEISLPYDFDLAYFIKELNLKVYWWEPGLVYQGSQSGVYGSSIR